ncbi:MAG: GntR family transcriptional regulator [Gemmataceae bacterium]
MQAAKPRIVDLADRIAADIRRRRLKPGDAYLTTAALAQQFGVGTTVANRAMQLLVQRRLLERRQRKGTTIASKAASTGLRRVHLLVHRHFLQVEGLLADGVVVGIQGKVPDADIQFNFMPAGGEAAHVVALVNEALGNPEPEGFVMLRAPLEAQRALAASGLPAVLMGTTFPSVRGLASCDRDNRTLGRLLAELLLARGVRWLGVLMRERMLHGDHLTYDGVQEAAAAAGLKVDAVPVRCLPDDPAEVRAAVELLVSSRRGKGGLVCRNAVLAEASAGCNANLDIAVCDVFPRDGHKPAFPYARATLNPQEMGSIIGDMLACQAAGRRPDPERVLVPVTVEQPAA